MTKNIYDLNAKIEDIYVLGDIHGNFDTVKYLIKLYDISNCVIVIAGDCGFGFEKFEFYKQKYNKQKKLLKDHNIRIFFVRGNHDDKSYFDNEKINFKYWKTIPDYSVLKCYNGNILCVGGAISIDRLKRIEKENTKKYLGKKFYWPDEQVVYLPKVIDSLKESNIIINHLITHSIMSFCPPYTKGNIESFLIEDEKLETDITTERKLVDKLYNHLLKNNNPIESVIHGHYHRHETSYIDDVKIVSLDCVNNKYCTWDLYKIKY